MIPDLDIYRAATVIIKRYGEDAPIHAAMRADAMLEAGDLETNIAGGGGVAGDGAGGWRAGALSTTSAP